MIQIGPPHRIDGNNELQVRVLVITEGKLCDGGQFQTGLRNRRGQSEGRRRWRSRRDVWDSDEDLNDQVIRCDSKDVSLPLYHNREQ